MLLALVGLVFVLLRLPVALRQIPAQDEDYFAVPGLTILNEGIPRIPYMPARNEDSAFYRCDEMLFTLPPLYFYLQAAFYWVFGVSTGIARVTNLVCAVTAAVVLFELTRRLTGSNRAALWASALYLCSRIVYFPALIARPDLLCGTLGLLCLLGVQRYSDSGRKLHAALAGFSGGLGMLTHPFALVFCLQAGLWVLLIGETWRIRLVTASIFTICALFAFSLWGILILQEPELFRVQFTNSVLQQSGPGLLHRLLLPFDSFIVQGELYLEHLQVPQTIVLGTATVAIVMYAVATRRSEFVVPAALTVSGIYLHVACQGSHPTKGYWVYTGGLQFICLGILIRSVLSACEQWLQRPSAVLARLAMLLACVMAFLPGSGIRTVITHFRHRNEVAYNTPAFTRSLMEQYDKTNRLVVDPGYIFDFYRAGYDVVLGLNYSFFFDVTGSEYDYVVGGPTSIRDQVPEALEAVETGRAGNFEDPMACRAVHYRHPSQRDLATDD